MTARITETRERMKQMTMGGTEAAEREAKKQTKKTTREGAIKSVERWAALVAERENGEIEALSPLSPFFTPTIDYNPAST